MTQPVSHYDSDPDLDARIAALVNDDAQSLNAHDLMLPDGYMLDDEGIICCLFERRKRNGISEKIPLPTPLPLFMTRIRGPVFGTDGFGDERLLCFTAEVRLGDWRAVALTEYLLCSPTRCLREMWRQGVVPNLPAKREMVPFLSLWIKRLDRTQPRRPYEDCKVPVCAA